MLENVYVIIPSLNPDEKLCNTVGGLQEAGFRKFIIVDDGSDRQHKRFFPVADADITVLVHDHNRGKGAAMKTAFRYMLRNCQDAEALITVDGDGQHTPKDSIRCIKALEGRKNTMVLGCRNFNRPDVPPRSKFGNKMTAFVLRTLCGIKISDSQTGLRAFPVSMLPFLLQVPGDRFEYETNMLLQCRQNQIRFIEVKIATVYLEENKSSHFHPIRDSFRIYKFIIAYFASSCISCVVDLVLFHILNGLLGGLGKIAVTMATVIARVASGTLNFCLNKELVFRKKGDTGSAFAKYCTLAVVQMLASAGLVTLLTGIFRAKGFGTTFIKMLVDTLLFFISYRIQQNWVFAPAKKVQPRYMKNKEQPEAQDETPATEQRPARRNAPAKKKPRLSAKTVIGRFFLCLGTLVLAVVIAAVGFCLAVVNGPSPSLRNMLVLSAKQASATKWVPGLFMSEETVQQILADSQKQNIDVIKAEDYNNDAEPGEWDDAIDGMKLIFLNEPNFKAYVLLIQDPSRVKVGVAAENFSNNEAGLRIFDMVAKYNAVAAINGGEFVDTGGVGKGGKPLGLTYYNGKCVWNDGSSRTFFGITNENKLICTEGMTKSKADSLGIRDAVSFQFGNVLIDEENGEIKLHYGDGNTGTAQRTAIAQRADGTFIFLVTDGRSAESIGATRNDVIDILVRYNAVTAGMLDGGSSAMLYLKNYIEDYKVDTAQLDEYQLQGLVNRYKAFTQPRRLPTTFIVTGE